MTPEPTTHDDDESPELAEEGGTVRPFAAVLREIGKGRTHDELTEGLNDLVGRVRDTGRKGTLTYVLTVEPLKDAPDVLTVHDEIKLKLPEHDRPGTIYFADGDNNLVRDDPNQATIPGIRGI